MVRVYQYKGFTIAVAGESDSSSTLQGERTSIPSYLAEVTIERTGTPVAMFSPVRLGDSGARAFSTEGDALMTGYSAARRIVDDLFAAEIH
jgi:hypothetical protein